MQAIMTNKLVSLTMGLLQRYSESFLPNEMSRSKGMYFELCGLAESCGARLVTHRHTFPWNNSAQKAWHCELKPLRSGLKAQRHELKAPCV
jgi:hypothetical protein